MERDPRERVVSAACYALVKLTDMQTRAATDAADAQWFPVSAPPPLAFGPQHHFRRRPRPTPRQTPLAARRFRTTAEKVTLSQVQHLCDAVPGTQLDKRNFRKRVPELDLLVPLKSKTSGPGRPARIHRFDPAKYERLKKQEFHFEL